MNTQLQPRGPILTAPLLPEVESKLIELPRSLSENAWDLQTVAPKLKVKDVAAHLLDPFVKRSAEA